MPELIVGLLALLAASLLLAVSTSHYWRVVGEGHGALRPWIQSASWILLALAASRFIALFGWEVGAAWFLLWLAIVAFAATLWMSWKPHWALWGGSLLAAIALLGWMV